MKCPICGSEDSLSYETGCQYLISHKIGKTGKILKAKKKIYNGSEGWSRIFCEKCNRFWDEYHFDIDSGFLELVGEGEKDD